MSTPTTTEQNRARKPNGRVQEERQGRRRRSDLSMGRFNILKVTGKDPAYTYRWINDVPGRVQQLTQFDDWDIVQADELGGPSDRDRGEGSNVERVVDKSSGRRAILVKKRIEYHEADKAKEQARIDEIDQIIKRGDSPSPEGLQGSHAYVPEGAINIVDGRKA